MIMSLMLIYMDHTAVLNEMSYFNLYIHLIFFKQFKQFIIQKFTNLCTHSLVTLHVNK